MLPHTISITQDLVVDTGGLARFEHFLVGCTEFAVAHVVHNSVMEKLGTLMNNANVLT